jgi:hypothetical protein
MQLEALGRTKRQQIRMEQQQQINHMVDAMVDTDGGHGQDEDQLRAMGFGALKEAYQRMKQISRKRKREAREKKDEDQRKKGTS